MNSPDQLWQPIDANNFQWNVAAAAHLRRRTCFGASWQQLQRDVDRGVAATLEEILDGADIGPDGRAVSEFEDISHSLEESARGRKSVNALERSILYRMIHSPHPLAERMGMMWHDHFPVGRAKISDEGEFIDFADRLRRNWDQSASKLHTSVLTSPAMLNWLDGVDNSKASPNENLAREFFELFSLGEGNYSEADIQESARAMTGMVVIADASTSRKDVKLDPNRHDGSVKTIFGEAGQWYTEDVVRLAVKQPSAPFHIARRLFLTFVSDQDTPSDELLKPLADRMSRDDDIDVFAGLAMLLRSRLFFDERYRSRRVKSPLEFIIGAIRGCSCYRPAPRLVEIALHARRMGYQLFNTPSVAGWPTGLSWLEGSWAIARANFAAEFGASSNRGNADIKQLGVTLCANASMDALAERLHSQFRELPGGKRLTSWLLSQPEAQLL